MLLQMQLGISSSARRLSEEEQQQQRTYSRDEARGRGVGGGDIKKRTRLGSERALSGI